VYSGSGTVYDFYTTEEQIAQDVVPYVELTDTALRYRFTAPFAGKARIRIKDVNGPWLYDNSWNGADKIEFSGSPVEGFIDFASNNLSKEHIGFIRVDLRPNDSVLEDSSQRYRWHFRVLPASALTPPADSDVNTQTVTTIGADKTNVSVAVTGQGGTPILEDVWFSVWLEENTYSAFAPSLFSAKAAYAAGGLYGPFRVKSKKSGSGTTLDIDINNLQNLDGSESSVKIPAGLYKIKFQTVDADAAGVNYAGVTATPVELAGTGGNPPASSDGSGGGGCDAGFGVVGLLLAGLAALKQRRS
jgi:hypothetical protein